MNSVKRAVIRADETGANELVELGESPQDADRRLEEFAKFNQQFRLTPDQVQFLQAVREADKEAAL